MSPHPPVLVPPMRSNTSYGFTGGRLAVVFRSWFSGRLAGVDASLNATLDTESVMFKIFVPNLAEQRSHY
jgi:hypothetical protein